MQARGGSINLIRRLCSFVIVQCLTLDSYSDLIVCLTKETPKNKYICLSFIDIANRLDSNSNCPAGLGEPP